MIKNGLSIDVDEFVSAFADAYNITPRTPYEKNISKEISHILILLKDMGIFATFFINGKSVAAFPDVMKKIRDAGHEIGCHGYSHKFINQYETQQEFEEDLERCLDLIYTHTKIKPIGYRAPGNTIFFKRDMVLSALKKYDFVYDSSVTSFGSVKHHGYREAPTEPFKWDNGIVEFPLSSARFRFFRIPAFGTYFLRLFPVFLTDMAISKLNRENNNIFFYFHAFELFKTRYPKEIMNISFPFVRIYSLFAGKSFEKKLHYILKKYQFIPYGESVNRFSDLSVTKDPVFK
jgi:polysaccharide deacetylase family protein (PEP-CTERM system associated)